MKRKHHNIISNNLSNIAILIPTTVARNRETELCTFSQNNCGLRHRCARTWVAICERFSLAYAATQGRGVKVEIQWTMKLTTLKKNKNEKSV